ncbi:hypothetical protein AB0G04_28910 [Actinoplanes sp. NPDC023801]|uniref:hypothetical protein n=1 Tax=Actinoplanes sp. NPDC023801 TaxID=3154595 RepID=UPI0033ECA54F
MELNGDLGVGAAARHRTEHLLLALGQRIDRLPGRTGSGERPQQPRRDAQGDQSVSPATPESTSSRIC